jgi:hypothetical protein
MSKLLGMFALASSLAVLSATVPAEAESANHHRSYETTPYVGESYGWNVNQHDDEPAPYEGRHI